MTIPSLRDWKSDLQERIRTKGQSEEDLQAVIHMCQETLKELKPAYNFVQDQQGEIQGWANQYGQLFINRFKKESAPLPEDELAPHMVLDTPEKRKETVRGISLAITKPGQEISDKDIFRAIQFNGLRFVSRNAAAAISTIMNGFNEEFKKVDGKSGLFKRKDVEETIHP